MRMRSTNPVLTKMSNYDYVTDRPITYTNVTVKTLFLLGIAVLTALASLIYFPEFLTPGVLIGAMIIGFISVIIGTRSINYAPIFGIIYAVSEGLVLGVVSALFAYMYEGIVITALTTTLLVFVIMLLLFSTNVIKVNQKFASFMVVALISVIIMSLIGILLPSVFGGSFYTIIVLVSAGLSAFFLLLDFQSIKTSVESGMDQKVGWILALGLMITIVWIYIEMLRLLALFSRNN
ncbi:MAG: Bax inhibitor-1/YccA family protein [Candidatus Izemoplasmatales bacterium]|uniref:Bax inhibitor-1/YccA family protein n=1 Tax=Hujiaoplasma nucleasis TaxID=2725268 RepID=A0A7L6N1Q4_9MOLU|nr:Bax inhibitor-1/YccA family protein [Hujiaoplasma nucleasis]QLY39362.1 Bax inhibitor-1/YccA family protein [Hujiaoplasma nucleasis]